MNLNKLCESIKYQTPNLLNNTGKYLYNVNHNNDNISKYINIY